MKITLKRGQKIHVALVRIYKRYHEKRGKFVSKYAKITFTNTNYGASNRYVWFDEEGEGDEIGFGRINMKAFVGQHYGVPFPDITWSDNPSRDKFICVGRTKEEAEQGIANHNVYQRYLKLKEKVISRMRGDLIDEQASMIKFIDVFDKHVKK